MLNVNSNPSSNDSEIIHSKLNSSNNLKDYRLLIELLVWSYSVQIWGTAKKSNINRLQLIQSKLLSIIV